ncbi:MAG: VCBS repeat-containing protein, partial [Planctomycetota bacterium]
MRRPHPLSLTLGIVAVLVATAEAQELLYTFTHSNNDFGRSVSGAGDVNKDGYQDLIVGGWDVAQVFSGKDGKILYDLKGNGAFGRSVSGAGDVNRDGYADVIVGAYADSKKAREAGSAWVFSGKDGAVLYTFYGDGTVVGHFGSSVSGAGDVNKDGYPDLIVGAEWERQQRGT